MPQDNSSSSLASRLTILFREAVRDAVRRHFEAGHAVAMQVNGKLTMVGPGAAPVPQSLQANGSSSNR